MARGSDAATGAATSAQNISNQSSGNSSALYGALAPTLESEMANPQGFGPQAVAEMTTQQQQGAGGSEAAAVGQGALRAARTRNAGTADAAIGQSTRTAGETLSKGLLATQMANARAKMQQQQEATGGLENLYGENLNSSVGALGQVASNVNANTGAENASWDWAKDVMDPILSDLSQSSGTILKAAGGK